MDHTQIIVRPSGPVSWVHASLDLTMDEGNGLQNHSYFYLQLVEIVLFHIQDHFEPPLVALLSNSKIKKSQKLSLVIDSGSKSYMRQQKLFQRLESGKIFFVITATAEGNAKCTQLWPITKIYFIGVVQLWVQTFLQVGPYMSANFIPSGSKYECKLGHRSVQIWVQTS